MALLMFFPQCAVYNTYTALMQHPYCLSIKVSQNTNKISKGCWILCNYVANMSVYGTVSL